MKKILILVTAVILWNHCGYSQKAEGKQKCIIRKAEKEETISSDWKTYTNNNVGFSFQYPGSWTKNGEDGSAINLAGEIIAMEINFIDTLSHSTLLIEYHLPPKGAEFYRYIVSQYDSSQGWFTEGGKQIEVAGNKAIEAFTALSIDGKGHDLNPPLRLILVDFLDKQQTGTIELQFKAPLPSDDIEDAKFNRLLSTFKFTN